MNVFDEFVRRVEQHTGSQGRRQGHETVLLCPAHDDHKPSLNVREVDGKPLAQCRSRGCSWEQICAAIGWAIGPDDPEAVYVYADETGKPLIEVGRFPGKKFFQRRAGTSTWKGGIGNTRRVPYRLPSVVEAVEHGQTVHVAEGEKCVHALEAAGFVATTNLMGAGKWRDEYAATLVGATRVVVWADCDEVGRDHAIRVAASVAGGGVPDVRVVELDRDRHDGFDVADLIASARRNGSGDDIRGWIEQIAEQSPRYASREDYRETTIAVGPPGTESRFPGLTHPELLSLELPPTPQLVDGLIEAGTPGTIAGLPETYKSWLGLQASLKVAGGGTVLGRDVNITGPVGYWWQDDSRENEIRRIQAYAHLHAFEQNLPVRWHLNEGLVLPEGIGALRAEIEREGQVLVVLDSLYNFLHGIRLKDEDVAVILSQLKAEVCDPTGCALAFVDHSPWPSEGNQGQRRGYGSVFKAAAIRWGIYLDRSDDTVFVEAHGNNITGLSRAPVLWDAERLELRLVEPPAATNDLGDRIAEFLKRNPGAATTVVVAGVGGNAVHARDRLKTDKRFVTVPPVLFGKPSNAVCWMLASDVSNLLSTTSSGSPDDVRTTLPQETDTNVVQEQPPYYVVVGGSADDVGSHPRPQPRPAEGGEISLHDIDVATIALRKRTGQIKQPLEDVIAEARRMRGEPSEDEDGLR